MSDYALSIRDTKTNKALPGSIVFYSPSGSVLVSIAADSNEVVQLNTDEDGALFASGNTFFVTAPNYNAVGPAPVSELAVDTTFYLDYNAGSAKSISPIVVIGAAAVAALFYFSKKRR